MLLLLVKVFAMVIVEPWIGRKIQAAFNEAINEYTFKIGDVHVLLIKSGIELDNVTLSSLKRHGNPGVLNGEITLIEFKGINIIQAIFRNDIYIREIIISNVRIKGEVTFPGKTIAVRVSPVRIRIGKTLINKIELALQDNMTARLFSMKEGVLNLYDLQIEKKDTISIGIVRKFDLDAGELQYVTPDSIYTYQALGISYSGASNTLALDRFVMKPNYSNYDFAAQDKMEKDRIEAGFGNINIHDFNALNYLQLGNLICSCIEVGEMDVNVFRDNRKEDNHADIPSFQDVIYNYTGIIRIDSIGLKNGNITYTEHAEKATEAGLISFNDINAKIYMITNDTIYKTETAYMELKGSALLMAQGKLTLVLKAKIYDSKNAFSLCGTLSDLEAIKLNPILEKNAFFYATSGKLDIMNFCFTADNNKATGYLTMRYHGLDLAVKNKRTDDTTAVKERLISKIVNHKVPDSNPIPGKALRKGIIDYEREPDRFLFNYCFNSILSGIKSSLIANPKRKKNS